MSEGRVQTLPFQEAMARLELPGLERNLFSSADWMKVMVHTYGLKIFVKFIERSGRIESYIFYSAVKNFLEWKICICSFCDYCDCPVASVEDWQLLFDDLRREYPSYRIAVRNLRDELVRQVPQLRELSRERFHELDLRPDLNDLWRQAHDSFKAAVSQARRNGVTVRPCRRDELNRFYDLHLSIRKNKYKIFPQPLRFFEVIWEQYMEHGQGVQLGAFDTRGELIAANIYLFCGQTMYYKFNTSSLRDLKLRPNNVLFWEGICLAKQRGMTSMDLGSSGIEQKGLILYKNHTGADMRDIIHLGFEPPGYRFSRKQILRFLTVLFTRPWVPKALVRWGSQLIYPYLA